LRHGVHHTVMLHCSS